MRNKEIGFVFQMFHLVTDLSVLDNVQIPLLYRRMSNGERRKLAEAALDRVGLSARLHHFPSQLSGGQQQRVAIARAIVGRPRILLADEPTGNLDSQMGDEIMAILKDLNHEDKTTIVMVTHDAQKAEQTERIVRLFDGRQVNAACCAATSRIDWLACCCGASSSPPSACSASASRCSC